jgi:Zn-finger nucleic acid-binding protein
MKCPVDDTTLVMSERQNVEIDYCPTCRGVWLDRGELDKIIAKVESAAPAQADSYEERSPRQAEQRYDDHDKYNHNHKKKRGGLDFFGELFD